MIPTFAIRLFAGLSLIALAFGLATPVRAENTATIPVPIRDIERGDVIEYGDLIDKPVSGHVGGNVMTDADAIVGMEARKPLRAGSTIAYSEVREPVLVPKGSLVTLRVSLPGIELTTMAKSMEQGALGEVIRVMNMSSMRSVQAVVTGYGTAEVPVAAQPSIH
ncbi:flagellar basal body P-ring formation chaperone FlgA [Zavarzinia compransoris]|uniref:flagellar basal body P-ring formation chaperone FlgA n=1 Tax=Zavarzinia marina TaxID=2911065 RepID=UPI001F1DDC30|nr:flagellar basal body P-ring formation chaperone FlgA [Zavarzinia marina]MCF4166579.1 flagellar basal body P-ring formation chaperone FlgA [Zavarzinia marina]